MLTPGWVARFPVRGLRMSVSTPMVCLCFLFLYSSIMRLCEDVATGKVRVIGQVRLIHIRTVGPSRVVLAITTCVLSFTFPAYLHPQGCRAVYGGCNGRQDPAPHLLQQGTIPEKGCQESTKERGRERNHLLNPYWYSVCATTTSDCCVITETVLLYW